MTLEDLITCYNKGCGQKYNPNENDEGKKFKKKFFFFEIFLEQLLIS